MLADTLNPITPSSEMGTQTTGIRDGAGQNADVILRRNAATEYGTKV
jgi:hypothetical protein